MTPDHPVLLRTEGLIRHPLRGSGGGERGKIPGVIPLAVGGWELDDIDVATKRHNIDIMLLDKTDKFVCLIENKIGASEHPGQLPLP